MCYLLVPSTLPHYIILSLSHSLSIALTLFMVFIFYFFSIAFRRNVTTLWILNEQYIVEHTGSGTSNNVLIYIVQFFNSFSMNFLHNNNIIVYNVIVITAITRFKGNYLCIFEFIRWRNDGATSKFIFSFYFPSDIHHGYSSDSLETFIHRFHIYHTITRSSGVAIRCIEYSYVCIARRMRRIVNDGKSTVGIWWLGRCKWNVSEHIKICQIVCHAIRHSTGWEMQMKGSSHRCHKTASTHRYV